MVLTGADPEMVFNALRLANSAVKEKDEVGVFLPGQEVELEPIQDSRLDGRAPADSLLVSGEGNHGLWDLPGVAEFSRFLGVFPFEPEGPV